MKHAKWFVAAALVVLSSMAFAQLSSGSTIVADVPFQFVAANQMVPAGKCVVQSATMDGDILAISNAGSNVGLFSMSSRGESKQGASHYALVFNKYGDRYFLSEIRLQGSKITYRLPASKVEKELRARNVAATEETLVASLQQ